MKRIANKQESPALPGFLVYRAAIFLLKKSLNSFLVRKVSAILKIMFFLPTLLP